MFGPFFEKNHLWNLIILGYVKKWSKCAHFSKQTDLAQNLIDNFFLALTVRGPFHGKDFKQKKNVGVHG